MRDELGRNVIKFICDIIDTANLSERDRNRAASLVIDIIRDRPREASKTDDIVEKLESVFNEA